MKKQKQNRTGLGKGVSALIPDIENRGEYSDTFFMCPIKDIRPNRYQPRTEFTAEELESLKESINEQGVIQPLLVRSMEGFYELIAGERRLRAARQTSLSHVPVFIKELTDEQMLEVSIIENVQRQDLNPLEEAEAYHRLIHEFNYTQEMVSKKIGKNRSTIANCLRLRSLPEPVKQSLLAGDITTGHARTILGAADEEQQIQVLEAVKSRNLSVRQTEKLINSLKTKSSEPAANELPTAEELFLDRLSGELTETLNSKVTIRKKGKGGKVEIRFKDSEELESIVNYINSRQ
ncbi:MAG: ParB/RepB/Spo0J family partition protein [Desulfobacteraceae bacterium]